MSAMVAGQGHTHRQAGGALQRRSPSLPRRSSGKGHGKGARQKAEESHKGPSED